MTAKLLWRRIKCLCGRHGFGGLITLDAFDYPTVRSMLAQHEGTFVERMNPVFHKTWYRVWVSTCPYCKTLSPVTENDVPIEMRA